MDIRNITQVIKVPPVGEILEHIFLKQKELADKYWAIEKMPNPPWNLHAPIHQVWLKDFMWRVVEELAEATEIFKEGRREQDPLFYEELSDALHFLIEPLIMLEITSTELDAAMTTIAVTMRLGWYSTVKSKKFKPSEHLSNFANGLHMTTLNLGLAGNCLKNKKWKQTQVLTDVDKFKARYFNACYYFFVMCMGLGMTIGDVYTVYMKKALVNKFRQETKY